MTHTVPGKMIFLHPSSSDLSLQSQTRSHLLKIELRKKNIIIKSMLDSLFSCAFIIMCKILDYIILVFDFEIGHLKSLSRTAFSFHLLAISK